MKAKSEPKKEKVIETLADTYRQLFVPPGPGAKEEYLDIVQYGHEPVRRDLSHFITSDEDSITIEETPAGNVTVITLGRREDFVTFLRIMANRCEMADIPDTQGATLLDGVINWRKIEGHRDEFLKGLDNSEDAEEAWGEEFGRFTSDKKNFKDTLIILSIGPYSAVPAKRLGLSDEEWITLSGTIRKYHECTHFICRKLFPEKKDAVWDELVADAVGILAAFGKYDADMGKLFLGIEGETYTGGRLENYVDVDAGMARKISGVLGSFSAIAAEHPETGPYELAVMLEEKKEGLYDL